jgi:hypothetical protein
MTNENIEGTDATLRRRGPRGKAEAVKRIDLPSGDFLMPRADFAREIGVAERTLTRMRVPVGYIANVAFVPHDETLTLIAENLIRRAPQEKRRARR